jgi:hypothetical protein
MVHLDLLVYLRATKSLLAYNYWFFNYLMYSLITETHKHINEVYIYLLHLHITFIHLYLDTKLINKYLSKSLLHTRLMILKF